MRQTLEALCRHAGTGSRIVGVPVRPAEIGMNITSKLGLSPLGAYHALAYGKSLFFDVSRAKNELGWRPAYSNEEMIIDSYEWYLRNRDKVLAAAGPSPHRSSVKQGILGVVKRLL